MELKVGKTVEENDNILKLLHISDSLKFIKFINMYDLCSLCKLL